MGIRESYDSAAEAYAEHLARELEKKPLDRHLLNRFTEETRGAGLVADLGCGPGHVARYLRDQGVEVIGIDLSAEMIRVASRLNPDIPYCVWDMTHLDFADGALAGAVAFYSIVHIEAQGIVPVLREVRRVVVPGGLVIVAFHIGDQIVHVDELFGARVSLDFHFHAPSQIIEACGIARLPVIEHIEREPYDGAEHPSRRCYLIARSV
jgi:SAM-dependent methyltransferase